MPKTILNRLLTLAFMVLVGFSIAFSIRSESWLGLTLALISLGAGIYFVYLLAEMKRSTEDERG